MKIKTLNRNYTLDLLKLFSAFMIVLIHVPFYGEFGTAIKAVARFAVPVFFMTSGYFCYKNDTKKSQKRYLISRRFLFLLLRFIMQRILSWNL